MIDIEDSKGMERATSLVRSTFVMSLATSISRITGYLRVAVLASAFGIQRLADSYNLANTMPNMIYELLMGGILSSLFIPIFVEYLTKQNKDEAWYVASITANLSFLILILFTLIGIIFSFPLVRTQTFLVPGSAASVELATFFFQFFVPQIIFYGLAAIFTGLLNSYRHFAVPAFAPIVNNLTVISTVLFFVIPNLERNPQFALTALAIGTTLGVISMALIQVPPLLKIGVRYYPSLDIRHPAIQKLGSLALPVLGYVLANQIGLTVTNNLAYQFRGGITAYQYSWYFFQLPYGIFAVSIMTALFPSLSEYAAKRDFGRFRETISLGMRSTGLIIIPASIALILLSAPIIRLFYQHGRFDIEATRFTTPVLTLFAVGLFSFAIYMFLTRAFYSLQDTKTPMKTNAIGVPVNIIANIILIRFLGVKGLALGHTLTYTFTMFVLLYLLSSRIGGIEGRKVFSAIVRFVGTSLVMVVPSFILYIFLENRLNLTLLTHQALQIALVGLLGLFMYLGLNYLLGSPELKILWQLVKGSRKISTTEGEA